MEQRSPEWFAERIGRITSTDGKTLLSPRAQQASRDTLMGSLVREVATASYKEVPDSFWMRHGRETEPKAIAAYELSTGAVVEPGGFTVNPRNHLLGDSPDGLVGFDGVLEAKCPEADNHGKTLVTGAPYDTSYVWQIGWHLIVGDHKWCDYISYCEDYPEHLRLFVRRYTLADVFPETSKKSRKKGEPDIVVTTLTHQQEALLRVGLFINEYHAVLKRLGLTLG